MRLNLTPSGGNRVAISYGPWLLAVAASDNFQYFNELTTENKLIGKGRPAAPGAQQARPFSIPVAATTFRCAQAEYPDQPATVELRAIAEQTGQATTSWELRLLTEKLS
jgi:hypothetical protein